MQEGNIYMNETDLKGQMPQNETGKPTKRKGYTLVKSKRGGDAPMIPIYEMNESRPSCSAYWNKDFKLTIENPALLSGVQARIARQIAKGHPSMFKTVAGFTEILATLGVEFSYRKILDGLSGDDAVYEVEGICTLYAGPIFVTGRSTKGKGMAPIEKVKRTFEAKNKKLQSALDAALNE